MTKDVLVAIRGMQFATGDEDEPIEVITAGNYYKKGEKHYIVYDEITEESPEVTKNIVKIYDNVLDITKRGAYNVHMVFELNKKNVTYYQTPFGSIMVGINAKKMNINESDHNINVNVEYALEMNYEHLANCTIAMNIKSMDSADFSLQGNN